MAGRIYFRDGELATLIRLTRGSQDAVKTQWGCQNPWLEDPTHRQIIALAHLRGVEHECEEVCAELPPLQVPSGAT